MRWAQSCGSLSILLYCPSLRLEWKLTFSSPVATAEFSKFAGILNAALSQHHLLIRELHNYNSLLNNHWQENVGSHQKKISHIQGQRRSPSKMAGGAKLRLESNPIPARDTWRSQTKPCMHQNPRPTETEWDLPLSVWVSPEEVWVSSGLPQGQGLWVQETWSHSLWHKPSWRRSPLTSS